MLPKFFRLLNVLVTLILTRERQINMSTQPGPPSVYGPIYPVSPSIHLGGLFQNAVITITGSQSGSLASTTYAGYDSDAWLSITKQPVVGEYIIVEQSINSVSSGVSVSRTNLSYFWA
jgi:hypothetical protein